MDTERDMDEASHERFRLARMTVEKIIDKIRSALDDSRLVAEFEVSQADFEHYVESHLQFLLSINGGTAGALQRNTVAADLWSQRGVVLNAFLIDNMPDRLD